MLYLQNTALGEWYGHTSLMLIIFGIDKRCGV